MAVEVFGPLIAASGAVILAGVTYWFTKKREREAELRKEKLEHYKEFVLTLSGVISGESTSDGQRAFARACNKLNLVAPQVIIKALQDFQQAIKTGSSADRATHDRLLSALLYEMRKDLQITPKDKDSAFVFGLWASGTPPEQ